MLGRGADFATDFDALNRPVDSASVNAADIWPYDGTGRLLTETAAQDALTRATTTTYDYDAAGNRLVTLVKNTADLVGGSPNSTGLFGMPFAAPTGTYSYAYDYRARRAVARAGRVEARRARPAAPAAGRRHRRARRHEARGPLPAEIILNR